MSINNARIAHWRIARNPAGKEVDLHPWIPGGLTMLKTATIRHCVGCTSSAIRLVPILASATRSVPAPACALLRSGRASTSTGRRLRSSQPSSRETPRRAPRRSALGGLPRRMPGCSPMPISAPQKWPKP